MGKAGLGEGVRGIAGNERVGEKAKFYTRMVEPEVLTEGEVKQQLVGRRKAERVQGQSEELAPEDMEGGQRGMQVVRRGV